MQRTRLNQLFDQTALRFQQWVFNPWRRLAVILISLLFGNFFATAISATAGQTAELDVIVSAFLVLLVELISWLYYRYRPPRYRQTRSQQDLRLPADSLTDRLSDISPATTAPTAVTATRLATDGSLEPARSRSRSTVMEAFNAFKLGLIYGLFVEAFKLGS